MARSRTLFKADAGNWTINQLGAIVVPGESSLDVTAYFTDKELMHALQNGLGATLSATQYLQVDDGAGTYNIDSAAKAATFYNAVAQLLTSMANAGHSHADAENGGQFAGLSALSDVSSSIGAEAKILATNASGQVSLSAAPSSGNHLVNKTYADSIAQGMYPHTEVRLATAAALPACTPSGSGIGKTLTADADGILSVDGVETNNGDRILVQDQVNAADNGVYVVTDKGAVGAPFVLTRATDFDSSATGEVKCGAFMLVTEGSTWNNFRRVLVTPNPITLETTGLVFGTMSGPDEIEGGNGIDITNGVVTTNNGDGIAIGTGGNAGKNVVKPDATTGATVAPVAVGANGVGVTVDNATIKHTAGQIYAASAPIPGNKMLLAFGRSKDIPNNTYLEGPAGLFGSVSTYRMIRAGKVTGMSAQVGTAGTTIDFEVHKNGSVMDATVDLALGAANGAQETDVSGSYANNTFAAGDTLSVYALNVAGAPKDAIVLVEIELT